MIKEWTKTVEKGDIFDGFVQVLSNLSLHINIIKNFLKAISVNPQICSFYCQEQLNVMEAALRQENAPFVLHIDATGSLIKSHGKRIFLYALCAKVRVSQN